MDANTHLVVYLNDHLAGAVTALQILDTLKAHDDEELKRFATELSAEIGNDRDDLEALMRTAGVPKTTVRRAVGWIGEKAAELKVRLDDPSDSGLRTFELLEVVALGIDGKRALWAVLQGLAIEIPQLNGVDYPRLARRADEQRAAVESRRREWARTAFIATPR